MESWRTHIRRGPVRALIAVCLLAGVFTMHGLTGNHDAAMAMTHQMPAAAAADRPAPSITSVDSNQAPRPELTVQAGHHGHLHAMGDVCLAMLAALLLAIVAALALRSLTVAHPVMQPGTAVRLTAEGPSPPWRRPTLSKLCVLRT